MFTRKGNQTAFDSLSVVELEVRQSPIGGAPHLKAKIAYVNAESGHTYGFIGIEHNTQVGLEILSPKTLAAWEAFCASLEQDQGVLVFGDGKHWVPKLGMDNKDPEAQAESKNGLNTGLGGGT